MYCIYIKMIIQLFIKCKFMILVYYVNNFILNLNINIKITYNKIFEIALK